MALSRFKISICFKLLVSINFPKRFKSAEIFLKSTTMSSFFTGTRILMKLKESIKITLLVMSLKMRLVIKMDPLLLKETTRELMVLVN